MCSCSDGLVALLTASTQLRKLIITDCHYLSGAVLQALARSTPHLSELDARRISEHVSSDDIIALCTGCPMLRRLALGGTRDTGSGIGMNGAELTDEAVCSMSTLSQLEVLNLHSFQRHFALDQPLLQLLQQCAVLKQLSLEPPLSTAIPSLVECCKELCHANRVDPMIEDESGRSRKAS